MPGWRALVVIACLAAAAPRPALPEEKLLFATATPPASDLSVTFMHPWADAINADGKGVLTIDIRDGSAIANNANYYDRVMANVAQISWGLESTVAGKFPRSDVATLPFMAKSSEYGSVALWRLYQSGVLDPEYADVHPLILVALTPAGIHMSHPLKSLDELGGAKLIVASKVNADAITLLGGSPLSIPLDQMYESIQRKLADGAAVAWTSFNPFKIAEVTSYHVDTRLGTSVGMIFMSRKAYEALSPEARKILDAHSGEAQSRAFGAWWDAERKSGKDVTMARNDGRTLVELTSAQTAAWRKKIAPLETDWVGRTPDGAKVLDAYRTTLAAVQGTAD